MHVLECSVILEVLNLGCENGLFCVTFGLGGF